MYAHPSFRLAQLKLLTFFTLACGTAPANAATSIPYSMGPTLRVHQLSADNRGVGLLAGTGPGGLGSVLIRRSTTVPAVELLQPRPVALAKVLDPAGKIVGLVDYSDQPTGSEDYELLLPSHANGGIYTISAIGGRNGDLISIGLPSAALNWGMRGELALGLSAVAVARDYYLYLPRTYSAFTLYVYGMTGSPMEVYRGSTLLGSTSAGNWNATLRRHALPINTSIAPAGSVLRLHLPTNFDKTFVFDGVPGVLCPYEAGASQLQGGTLEAANGAQTILTAGPIQKRVREWMRRQHQLNPNYSTPFTLPTFAPSNLPNPTSVALLHARPGILNTPSSLNAQVLNPDSPYFGAVMENVTSESWERFTYPAVQSAFDCLAVAGTLTTHLNATNGQNYNPLYLNENLKRRAILYAFYHLASMDGAHLLREGNLSATSTPITHTFFVYYSLAQSFYLLKEAGLLDAETEEIWRDGLLAIGDKQADYRAFQSNQWGHMLVGHLFTYLATGEARFRQWFEEQMTVELDCSYGRNSKFGQHPAGYFLEEYGPDGNYDSMNLTVLVEAYNRYRDLASPDPVLLAKMASAIQKNLTFKSYFWLPQPGAGVISPAAMNCRVPDIDFSVMYYPGITLAHSEFPLAEKRRLLVPVPSYMPGISRDLPHLIYTDSWAINYLNWSLQDTGATPVPKHPGGTLDASICYAARRPQTAAPALLPCEDSSQIFNEAPPGVLAWKQNGLYGASFYAVDGGAPALVGKFGGGPSCLWSAETGLILCSEQTYFIDSKNNNKLTFKKPAEESEVTHSAVYWTDGTFYCSGLNNNAVRQWAPPYHQISETVGTSTITWKYNFSDPIRPKLTVEASPLPAGMKISLPLYTAINDTVTERLAVSSSVGSFIGIYNSPAGRRTFRITWPGAPATLSSSTLGSVRRLVIPMTTSSLELTMTFSNCGAFKRNLLRIPVGSGAQ